MNAVALLVFTILLVGIHGTCPPNIIKNIQSYWKVNPICKTRAKLTGNIMWLTAASYLSRDPSLVDCFSSTCGAGQVPYQDVVYYQDIAQTDNIRFKEIDEKPGVLQLKGSDLKDDKNIYIISYNHNVFTSYQCQDSETTSFTPFSAIGLVNLTSEDIITRPEIKQAIDDAYSLLSSMKLNPLKRVFADCY